MAEIFMKPENITGESLQSGYEGWIEILSASQSIMAPSTIGAGGGAGGSKPTVTGISVVAQRGKHSSEFSKAILNGVHWPKVEIHWLKPTGQSDTMEVAKKLTMERVYVENGNSSDSSGEGIESFTLGAEKYTWEYFAQDGTGQLTSTGEFGFDSKTGQVFG